MMKSTTVDARSPRESASLRKKKGSPTAPVSTDSTGGRGFNFTDEVASLYLAAILTGDRLFLPSIDAPLIGIYWETRGDGFHLDDLLLHFQEGSAARQLAISGKQNLQVTRNGFPTDFVRAAWRQWLHVESDTFDPGRDFLGLVIGRLASDVEEAWSRLLEDAIQGDPDRVARRYTAATRETSSIARRLFSSLQCPTDLRARGRSDPAEAVRLLSRIRLLHYDFRSDPSRSGKQRFDLCQKAVGGDPDAAARLQRRLNGLAAQRRPGHDLNRVSLLRELRSEFSLADFPDDQADWSRLARFAEHGLDRVQEFLADRRLTLLRPQTLGDLEGDLKDGRSLALLGESGAGKSALAKIVARRWRLGRTIWLDAIGTEVEDLLGLERKIGLRTSLEKLLPLAPDRLSLLVLDGLERWTPGGLDCAARLIQLAPQLDGWVLLITVRADRWPVVREGLMRRGVTLEFLKNHALDLPSAEDLRDVWPTFPSLRSLALRPELGRLLHNLQVLSWLADFQAATGSWLYPSQLIDGLWKRWVASGPNRLARGNTLKTLARLEAERLGSSLGLSSLEGREGVLQNLEEAELIRIEEDRVTFRHDLLGDWARLRILIEEAGEGLGSVLPQHALSPFWYSAIRLFSQRLLEQGSPEDWLALYHSLSPSEAAAGVACDLLLDGLIFASNSEQLLERLWPQLVAGDGQLLRLLLKRFLFVATEPHPQIRELDENVAVAARAVWRVPYWPYWGPVLRTLDRHRSDVATKAPLSGAEICGLWLEWTPRSWKWRQEAARTALEIARAQPDAETSLIFEALLWAAPELPEEVADLSLRLSRRKEEPQASQDAEGSKTNQAPVLFLHRRPGRLRPPYPDGPRSRVGRGFQKAVLSSRSLEGLVTVRPATAREVLLACCLQEPRWESARPDHYLRDIPGVHEWMEGYPPMYLKGPFLRFLQLHPDEGLEVILRLVNQATMNWAERRDGERHKDLVIRRRRWIGNKEVYVWRHHSSNVILSALTALEKWLYDELDQGRSVGPAIRVIFKRSRSAAFAGLLVELGKKEPQLFQGPLLPLLGVWQLYDWDWHAAGGDQTWRIFWHGAPQPLLNDVQEWHGLPHRRIALLDISRRFVLHHPQMAEAFAEFRQTWTRQLKSARFVDQDEIQRLIARLDPANYDDADEASFQCPEPLRERSERASAALRPSVNAWTFAGQCHQLLERQERLDLEQAEVLWNNLLFIENMKDQLREEQYADAITGGIAALLLLPGDWGREHPDERDECKRLFFKILEEIPPADDIGHSIELLKEHWPGFAAETAVALLAEEPTHPRLRQLTAMAIMSRWHNSETAAIAMVRGFRERRRLGDDWERMQNLTILWAALHSMGYHFSLQEDSLLHRWASRLARWFVQARLPSHPLDWKKVAQGSLSLRNRFYRKELAALEDEFADPWFHPAEPTSLGLNPHDLKSAFSWLPDLQEASSTQEREAWLDLYRRLLEMAIAPFLAAARLARDEPSGIWPEVEVSGYTSWLLGRIAVLILRLLTPYERQSFWEPLFSPGEAARDLILSFLRSWFYTGSPAADSPDHFVQCWQELIHYAAALERNGQGGAVDWNLLMGLQWQGPAEYRPAVGRLLPLYHAWAAKHLNDGRTVKQFARFLGAPAAFDLVPSGIVWLAAALPSFRESRETDLDEAIIDLLRASWRRITPDSALKRAFQELFAWVVQRATPAALVLQEEIRGWGSSQK
jgi:hypothetical protein